MGYASSADRSPVRRGPAWLPLAAAALVVPTALAGLTLLWPRPQIEAELARTAAESLSAAGLTGAQLTFSGRDATVTGLTGADGERAVQLVQGVTGVRAAQLGGSGTGGATGPDAGTVLPGVTVDNQLTVEPGTADPGSGAAGAAGELDDAGKQELQSAIDALVTGAPITFEPNSPALTAQGSATVAGVLQLVGLVPAARLQVDGFVATGPGDGRLSAQELSDQRAAAVRDALVAGGVPAENITADGRGEGDSPLADAAGRRAAITVV